MTDLAAIAEKLGRYVRLLSSDQDGEVVAAAHAIVRVLKTAGADIHTLAKHIETPNNKNTAKLSDAEMRNCTTQGTRTASARTRPRNNNSMAFVLTPRPTMKWPCGAAGSAIA